MFTFRELFFSAPKLRLAASLALLSGASCFANDAATVSFYGGQVSVRAAAPGEWQWHPLAVGNGGFNLGLTFDPKDPERIYLQSDVSGIIRTTNGGKNWMTSNKGLHGLMAGNYSIGAIAVDPKNSSRVYASAGRTYDKPSGIVRSDDGGESWNFISSDICVYGEGKHGRKQGGPGILIDSRDTTRLYAIDSMRNAGAGGVHISDDEGATWRPSGLDTARVGTLRFHPDNEDVVFASAINHDQAPGGMYRSDDRGKTWRRIGLEGKNVFNFQFERTDASILYATAGLDGIFKSTDGGESWTAINTGLPLAADGQKGRFFTYTWRGIDTSPHRPGHIVITADVIRAFYESPDYGATWARLPFKELKPPSTWMLSPEHMGWRTSTIYFHPTKSGVLFACDFFATWRSDDGGATWVTNPYGAENSCMVTVLPDATQAGRIYLGLWDHDLLIYQDDAVAPKTQRVKGTRHDTRGTNHHASALAQNEDNPDHLLAVMNSAALIRSTDRGASWTRVDAGLPAEKFWRVGSPVFAPTADLAFLPIGSMKDEGADARTDGVYVSEDEGLTWNRAANQGLGAIDVTARWDPRQNVFAATPDAGLLALVSKEGGLYLSNDCAATWRRPELPDNARAGRVALAGGAVYVGTTDGGGVWRGDNHGEHWQALWTPEADMARPTIELLAVDAKNPSRILIHTTEKPADVHPSGRIVYRLLLTEDGGATWTELLNDTLAIWRLRSISFDPFDADRIFASTQWGGTWSARRPPAK